MKMNSPRILTGAVALNKDELERESAFGILEALAGFGAAGLFAFHHAGITRQEAFFAHGDPERIIQLGECAGYAVGNRSGLALHSAAGHIDKNIVLGTDFGGFERAHDDPLRAVMTAKIVFEALFIDHKLSAAGQEANPG
jgi:hypothetical protein